MSETTADRLFQTGQTLAKRGAIDEARAVLETALTVDPDHFESLLWLGATATEAEESIRYLGRALVLRPESRRAAAGLAWARERLRKSNRTSTSASHDHRPEPGTETGSRRMADEPPVPLSDARPSHPEPAPDPPRLAVVFRNDDLGTDRKAAPVDDITDRIEEGIGLLDEGQIDHAVAVLEEALRFQPNSLEALEQLGLAFYRSERPRDAERVYRRMLSIEPDHAEANANLGLLLLESGNEEEAERCYRLAVTSDPTLDEVRLALADLFRNQGRIDEAVAEWRVVANRNPSIAEFRVKIGDAYANAGRYEEAAAAYSRAIERGSDDPSLRLRLGRALRASGRTGAALEQFRDACRGPFATADAFVELAASLIELGREQEASEALEQALVLNPADTAARDLVRRLRPWTRPPTLIEGGSVGFAKQGGLRDFLRRGIGSWR